MDAVDKANLLLLMILLGPVVLVFGCCDNKSVESEVDKATYERVFLECIKAAKGPNSITAAGNDTDEVVSWCRFSAKDIASK